MESEEIRKYQRLLITYFQKNHPEKLKYQPKVIEVNEDKVVFGLIKCIGRLQISKIKLVYLPQDNIKLLRK